MREPRRGPDGLRGSKETKTMENIGNIILGIMIPFAGTTLGAACVYFMKKGIRQNVEKGLLGFASGVMVAASVWSLLIPSMNLSADLGRS